MTVLTRRCVESAIAQGYDRIDWMIGADQEKLRWAGQPREVTVMRLGSGRLRSRLALTACELAVRAAGPLESFRRLLGDCRSRLVASPRSTGQR